MVSRCESGASPFTPNDGRAPRGGFFLCLALAVPVSLLAFSFPLALALAFAFPSQSLNPTPFSAAILGGLLTLTDAIDLFVSLTSLNFCGSYFAFRSCVFFSRVVSTLALSRVLRRYVAIVWISQDKDENHR